ICRYRPDGSDDSCSTLPSSMKRFSGTPDPDANTTARPIGCPQPNAVALASIGGRLGASALSPRTRRSPSSPRPPCGPHPNGPASLTANRHDTASLAGSSAQARPDETKDTVCDGVAPFAHPAGSTDPSARTAPTGGGGEVDGPVAPPGDDGAVDPPCVHPARSMATASDHRTVRMTTRDATPGRSAARGTVGLR